MVKRIHSGKHDDLDSQIGERLPDLQVFIAFQSVRVRDQIPKATVTVSYWRSS